MVENCDYSVDRFEITGGLWCECLRTLDHDGPHLIKNNLGKYVIWKTDLCDEGEECEGCDSEDPADWCLAFGQITKAQAKKLIKDPTLESIKSA
jgi:hypothetical protein